MSPSPASLPTDCDVTLRGRVAEVFRSWQGEGALLGRRMVFVRLAGCTVDCRYCDTAWAFETPATVARPTGGAQPLPNPLSVADVVALVDAADPADTPGGPAPVALTGGEPCEQAEFALALIAALAPRDVLLETSALHADALGRLAPRCRWIAADCKLPAATGQPDVLARHATVLESGVLTGLRAPPDGQGPRLFFKLIVDGDTPDAELHEAAELLARHAPDAPVFVQPVTPLGGSPALPRQRFDAVVDALIAAGLSVRLIPQMHKRLGVR